MSNSPARSRQPPPPPDGGWGWVAVAAAFVAHTISSGYMLSLSVFLVEWRLYFETNAQTVSLVGVILGFLGPVMGLPAGGLTKTFGCRIVVIIAGLCMSLGMFLSMFATKIYHLYLTTAIIAIGIGFVYQPAVTVIGFYFQKKLGLANGIAMSGVGIGMLVVSPMLQLLIDKYTWQKTYLILAGLVLILIVCGLLLRPSARELYFLNEKTKHRRLAADDIEETQDTSAKNSSACYYYFWRCIKFFGLQLIWQNPSINFIFVAFGLLGFGFYSSLVFFTAKAVFDLGIEQSLAAWLISLVGMGSFTARLLHGVLIDLKVVSPMMLFVISAMTCSISNLMNPFTTSFAGLAICAIFLGVGSGMGIAVTIVCIREAVHPANVSNAWGIAMMTFGMGNLVGVYSMAFLYDTTGSYSISFFFAAGILSLGALSMLMLYIIKRRQEKGKTPDDIKNEDIKHIGDNIGDNQIVEKNSTKEQFVVDHHMDGEVKEAVTNKSIQDQKEEPV